MAEVRPEDVGRLLLLLLRQQDDHHGRGGDGRHGRSGAGGPDAADVASRPLARRVGTILRGGTWDYRILAPGYKYNLTDIAAAIGIHQLARAEEMRARGKRWRADTARSWPRSRSSNSPDPPDRIHAWHLFPIRLRLERLAVDRNRFMEELKKAGVGCSVHWRPLHLHPYYAKTFGWRRSDLPAATALWPRLVSLPIFPGMREDEIDHVVRTLRALAARHGRETPLAAAAT